MASEYGLSLETCGRLRVTPGNCTTGLEVIDDPTTCGRRASVIRREAFDALGGFDETLQGYEDDDLYVRIFRSGWRFAF